MENKTAVENHQETVPLKHYGELFSLLDPAEAVRRTGAEYNPDTAEFTLTVLGKKYHAKYPEFALTDNDGKEADTKLKILCIRYLLFGNFEKTQNAYLTYKEIPWGEAYFAAFEGRCIKRAAFSLGRDINKFRGLIETQGHTLCGGGDCACIIEFMPGLFVKLIVWEGDEEFSPCAQILFSDNFPLAFSSEDIAVVGDVVLNNLK